MAHSPRTVLRFPESNKWDKDELAKVRVTPWSLHVPKETEVVFKDKKEIEQMDTQGKLVIARQPYLKAAGYIKYGLTKGCPKCDHEIPTAQDEPANCIP